MNNQEKSYKYERTLIENLVNSSNQTLMSKFITRVPAKDANRVVSINTVFDVMGTYRFKTELDENNIEHEVYPKIVALPTTEYAFFAQKICQQYKDLVYDARLYDINFTNIFALYEKLLEANSEELRKQIKERVREELKTGERSSKTVNINLDIVNDICRLMLSIDFEKTTGYTY